MPVLDKKYDKLALNDDYLSDPLLMALAWKKAHDYIRTTNWYADNFELDISSIDLPNRCVDWINESKSKLVFSPLELVPAPKTQPWEFIKPEDPFSISEFKLLWQPVSSSFDQPKSDENPPQKSDKCDLKLRPLAHTCVRDQTIMTLVMMCLANEVEAIQGDPATNYDEVHDKGVVSYGNRLFCRYEADKVEHSYGSTTTYSKYFTDYRKFLERPYYFARRELHEKAEDEEVYLIELDLSKFFDCIDRNLLINKIEDIVTSQAHSEDSTFTIVKNILTAFKNWEWSDNAEKAFGELFDSKNSKNGQAPRGLPQGLVASGFLSNIYMAEFDEYMSTLIGKSVDSGGDIKVVDYSRYVDDMRIVIVGPNRKKLREALSMVGEKKLYLDFIKEPILKKMAPELKKLNLELNKRKTKVEVFRGKSVGISSTLEEIQQSISGPVSYEDANVQLGQLESLLSLSSASSTTQDDSHGRFNRLAVIEKDIFDVREDTLKRFAANKISRLLNDIRHFTAREVNGEGEQIPGDWDYLQERLARRLVACWSRDPALVLLLKKGLELFPSTKLLDPIMEQLNYLRDLPDSNWFEIPKEQLQRQVAIANYCLSEIYRHAATVIHRKDDDAIPAHADIDGFFESIQISAIKVLKTNTETVSDRSKASKNGAKNFDLLATQARFLLLVRLDTTLEATSEDLFHDYIFKLARGFREITLPDEITPREVAAGILVASQLVNDKKPLRRAIAELLEAREDVHEILELIAVQDVDLFRSLLLHARSLRYWWSSDEDVNNLAKKLYIAIRPSAKPLTDIKKHIPLYKLISRPDNPFTNEIMALKLMLSLIDEKVSISKAKSHEVINLSQTKVQFDHFCNPPTLDVFNKPIKIEIAFQHAIGTAASHLHAKHDDTFILQRIALCLRAALAGNEDPTGFGQSHPPKAGYRGLKSTRFKRQIGLMTTPESLTGENAQFSGWLTTLLSKLLKWPGIRVNDLGFEWPNEISVENVKSLVEERLDTLKQSYCRLSEMPSVTELVTPSWESDKKSLRVAMVQSKLPQKADFLAHGLLLDDPTYRAKHRRHVARIAKLVIEHITAQHIEKPPKGQKESHADLILWPELAVHKDDIDVLVQLSRKTHAIVLAGLTFLHQPSIKGPNNTALWIVPKKHNGNQNEIKRLQGKHNLMKDEHGVVPWRPYQLMLELKHPKFPSEKGFMLTGSICFDATDISLSADLRDKSNTYLIPALNQDVNSFDTMVDALNYHMFQHVVLVNTGEFGSSYAKAPYKDAHKRLIAHSTGNDQVAINTFEINMFDFRRDGVGSSMKSGVEQKSAPAGVNFEP